MTAGLLVFRLILVVRSIKIAVPYATNGFDLFHALKEVDFF